MPTPEQRLARLGHPLPAALVLPKDVVLPFRFARVVGSRVLVAGHGPTRPDGHMCGPYGKVGAEVSEEEAIAAARLTALAILGTLKRELGELSRIKAWTRVFGMVNSAAGFHRQPAVINGFSDLILEVFGPDVGAHARSAIGVAGLPFNLPVEIEAEVEVG